MTEKVKIDPNTLANLVSATESEMRTLQEVLEEDGNDPAVLRGLEGRIQSLDASVTIAKDELETQSEIDVRDI